MNDAERRREVANLNREVAEWIQKGDYDSKPPTYLSMAALDMAWAVTDDERYLKIAEKQRALFPDGVAKVPKPKTYTLEEILDEL